MSANLYSTVADNQPLFLMMLPSQLSRTSTRMMPLLAAVHVHLAVSADNSLLLHAAVPAQCLPGAEAQHENCL